MSTPPDSLGKDARALIRAARGGDEVPPEERRRVLEAFARRRAADELAAGSGRSAGLLRGPAPVWRRRRAAPRLSWAVAALVLTGSLAALARQQGLFQRIEAWLEEREAVPEAQGGAAQVHPRSKPAPSPVPPEEHGALPSSDSMEPPAAGAAEPGTAARAMPSPASSSSRSPAARALPAATPGSSASSSHAAELELIAAARSALGERRFDVARRHAEQHARRFPRGTFSEEREAILALSDCRSQRGSELGERFVSERPASLLAERVRRDCGLSAIAVPGAKDPDTH